MSPKPFVPKPDDKPGHTIPAKTLVIAALAGACVWLAIGLTIKAYARPAEIHPVPAPTALIRERAKCTSLQACKNALREAYQANEWQQKARRDDARRNKGYGVQHALRLASALYGVPLSQLERVGSCESHLYPLSKNRSSTASGLFQFLDSTWNRAGVPGFSVFDAYANAIAAARLVSTDGSWREWSCQP